MKRIVTCILFVLLTFTLAPRYAAVQAFMSAQSFIDDLTNGQANLQKTHQYGLEADELGIALHIDGLPMAFVGTDDPQRAFAYFRGSALGVVSSAISVTFNNKPADLALWVRDTGQTLGFVPKLAYAQGIGFSGLTPLLPMWKMFRNVAYLLMALVMIIIGFMIMFRKKIDPKTVVTAQNAIPRVIIALILITFSYAIVGFVIDIMYLVLFLLIALFKSAGLQDPNAANIVNQIYGIKTAQDLYGNSGLLANYFNISTSPWQIFGVPINSNMAAWLDPAAGILGLIAAIAGIAASSSGVGIGVAVLGVGAMLMPIVHLILAIALLILFLRLLILFVTAYIQIIIALLLAPLQLLTEAIPGSTAFSSWFKNLIANVVVFPIGGAMFMLSAMFSQMANQQSLSIWRPPYTAVGASSMSVAALVSFGILFAIPSIAGSVKEALKAKPTVPVGFNIGGPLQAAFPLAVQGLGMWWQKKSLEPVMKMASKTGIPGLQQSPPERGGGA